MTTETMEGFKSQGNAAFAAGRFEESIKSFTAAISLDPNNHVLYSNRSAAYASLRDYQAALKDAETAVHLKNDWAKGHGRRGAALLGLGRFEEARAAYDEGLKLEPDNAQLHKGLDAALQEIEKKTSASPSSSPLPRSVDNPFSDPSLWERLRADPRMREHLQDPQFVKTLEEIKQDPKNLTKHLNDQRVMQAFMTMLGVNPDDLRKAQEGERETRASEAKVPESARPSETKDKDKDKEQEKETTGSLTDEQIKAQKEKELGNEAYKRKDFEGALSHYDAAIALDSENVSLLTNKAAVYFEQGNYEQCIVLCEEAVQKGRAIYADFKLIAKALGRIGSAHERMGNLSRAIEYYQKSLTEHRTAEILGKLREAEKVVEQQQKAAYHDPVLAEEARNGGNELFKAGDFVGAIKQYTEAIKRDEKDPRAYSNRAACYLKLAAVPEGLKDCDKAISLDSANVKAYIRKAALLQLRHDYTEALETLELAAAQDAERKHTMEIAQMKHRIYDEIRKTQANETEEETIRRAMQNPEIREIMQDPVMGQILKQMQNDPKALMEHMANPVIAQKIRKLIAAGVIKTGY